MIQSDKFVGVIAGTVVAVLLALGIGVVGYDIGAADARKRAAHLAAAMGHADVAKAIAEDR